MIRFQLKTSSLMVAALGLMACASTGSAQVFTVNIQFNENCIGTLTNAAGFFGTLPCTFRADPGPGGLANVMFYDMLNPPGLVSGDVKVMETADSMSDLLRFDANLGGVFVYSDLEGGIPDALADIGFPIGFNTNLISVLEIGPEGNNGIVYTPTAGQPGFVTGSSGPITVTYTFISDAVPEPASMGLLLMGGAALMWRRRRARS